MLSGNGCQWPGRNSPVGRVESNSQRADCTGQRSNGSILYIQHRGRVSWITRKGHMVHSSRVRMRVRTNKNGV